MTTTDRLTPELRKIEKEIDNYYKSNPLAKLPFATAAWYLLTSVEHAVLMQLLQTTTSQERETILDNTVFDLKYCMRWLWDSCSECGQIPSTYHDDFCRAGLDLFFLAHEYKAFFSAYTYASRCDIELELEGSTIKPSADFGAGIEYEAYNRVIKQRQSQKAASSADVDKLKRLKNSVRHSLKIRGERFEYKLNSKIVASAQEAAISPVYSQISALPDEWQFSRYKLGDFRRVVETISAIAFIHALARQLAIENGCLNMGYADSIYMPSCDELLERVVRYSEISESNVQSILDDLSYSNKNISDPDPALQPLIVLNSKVYAIMPHLFLARSPERNMAVLLNRLPSERKIYSGLTDNKEGMLRRRFTAHLSDSRFRFISGKVQDLPDVDLAIISDPNKSCLLLELKSFIEPAEVSEIGHKSEEIEKGISQILQLKHAFANNHQPLLDKLKVDSSYRLEGIVVSENWIGHATVQSPEIPVIQADDFIEKLRTTESLESSIEWLKVRKYLPKEGEHFEIGRQFATIGNWTLDWYGIELLSSDAFPPL